MEFSSRQPNDPGGTADPAYSDRSGGPASYPVGDDVPAIPSLARRDRPLPNPAWTAERVRALGMTTSLETAAEILGIGRTLAYTLVRDGEFPVEVLRLGRRVLIPVPALLKLLGAN